MEVVGFLTFLLALVVVAVVLVAAETVAGQFVPVVVEKAAEFASIFAFLLHELTQIYNPRNS